MAHRWSFAVAVVAAVSVAGAVSVVGATSAHAGGATTVVVTQAAGVGQVSKNDMVTAVVQSGGAAVPDGTPVQFRPQGGLLADHEYSSFALTPSGKGYYLAAFNGTVRTFGDAVSQGDLSRIQVPWPVTSMALTPDGSGYWLLDANGGVSSFNAPFYGSASGDVSLSNAADTITASPNGQGYWILLSDDTVHQYGHPINPGSATYDVSQADGQLPEQVVADPAGGFWVVYSGGDIGAFDGAPTMTAFSGVPSDDFLTSAVANPTGTGLWAVTAGGTVVTSGTGVPNEGNLVDSNAFDLAMAAAPDNAGYYALGWDGQVETAGSAQPASPLRDAWSAVTAGGAASLEVTGTAPGFTSISASSLDGTSPSLSTEWSVPPGYWAASSAGGVASQGSATFYGAATQYKPQTPTAAIAATPDGRGYWELSTAGGLFNFGDAGFSGAAVGLDQTPFVGMAADPFSDTGYWMVARDGAVFSYNAPFQGSAHKYTNDAVAIVSDPTGAGYWVLSATGGIFAFGAPFDGPVPHNGTPIVGLAPTWDGLGYWVVNANGAVFAVGDAKYEGGARGLTSAPIVGIEANPGLDDGYWLVAANGQVLAFGSAPSAGSVSGFKSPVVGLAADWNYDVSYALLARAHPRSPLRYSRLPDLHGAAR